ncbi:enoyl-CoA hydratase/isomerase family protein [Phenylobacterium sp. J367]|uniref:enoyl-CoA hydratase/isomerase family protein n=1 Tax=Phenylobacterium sp. J367 TaxID=2898435 RepID=UPI0021513FBB|nr:enoyl-CoA hydratase-related protein [Phenylobacterium sp. J367]MCR5880911.1 enoyl-CoA hydratase-related protein [Phenylobacterium sp. J367]
MVSIVEKAAGFEAMLVDLADHVATITLNRPERRNALSYRAYDELEQGFRLAAADPEVRCVIVTGADPAFCSGDDVAEIMAGPKPVSKAPTPVTYTATPAAIAALECDKPVIAAVNGAAVGWGMELALFADIRIASERARFGELFVKRGLVCDVGGFYRLPAIVGPAKAAELLFTGEVFDAAEALRIGLVSEVTPHAGLMDHARTLAGKIAANPPLAVRHLKAGLTKYAYGDPREIGAWAIEKIRLLMQTHDHREGVASFLEKREPVFEGR